MLPFDNLKGISVTTLIEINPVDEEVRVHAGIVISEEEENEDIPVFFFLPANRCSNVSDAHVIEVGE